MNKICVVYTHGKLGDLIWQLPYIKAISDFHNQKITLISRPTTHAKILYKDLNVRFRTKSTFKISYRFLQ